MAQLTGVTDSYRQVGLREDLWDVITNISPMVTPFISNIGRVTAKARTHTWIKDSLAAATSNKHIEGDESAFVTASSVVPLSNTLQILKKAFMVSGTLEAVDKAGRKSEVKYQLTKAGRELLLDLEFTATGPQKGTEGAMVNVPNGFLRLADQYDYEFVGSPDPPSMSKYCLQTAIDILQGKPVMKFISLRTLMDGADPYDQTTGLQWYVPELNDDFIPPATVDIQYYIDGGFERK